MKTYPHQEDGEIINLVRKDDHDAVVRELKKHLEDANRGAERNAHINRSFAGQINQLHSDVRELNERLTKQQADMLDTIVDLRADLTRYSTEREHNAMQALMWQSIAEKLANAGGWSAEPDSSWDAALAAYESAKAGNIPDPLAEAVKRMEKLRFGEIEAAYWQSGLGLENVRALLISAAKGEHP